MHKILFILITLLIFIPLAKASDACLYGDAVNSDGSKIDGSARITTSWNNTTAFPRNGRYELCLGSNPRQTITIYVNGNRYTDIKVDGDTRLDVRR